MSSVTAGNNSVAIQSDLKYTTITQYANLVHHGGIEGSDHGDSVGGAHIQNVRSLQYHRGPAKNDKMVDIATWDRSIWKNSRQFSLVNIPVEMIGLHDITAQNVSPDCERLNGCLLLKWTRLAVAHKAQSLIDDQQERTEVRWRKHT